MRHSPQLQRRIADAQLESSVMLVDGEYKRLRHGEHADDWGDRCSDCGVGRGQFHVPRCDLERCPRCSGQAFGVCDECSAPDEDAQPSGSA